MGLFAWDIDRERFPGNRLVDDDPFDIQVTPFGGKVMISEDLQHVLRRDGRGAFHVEDRILRDEIAKSGDVIHG